METPRLIACAAMIVGNHAASFCRFARFLVVGGYKTQGVCHERFTVLHATLGHFHDAFGNYLAHGT
jgi:hypothetical protein